MNGYLSVRCGESSRNTRHWRPAPQNSLILFKTEKTSTTLNLSLLTEGYDADAKGKLHQCGSTVRLSVNGRGRRDLLIGR